MSHSYHVVMSEKRQFTKDTWFKGVIHISTCFMAIKKDFGGVLCAHSTFGSACIFIVAYIVCLKPVIRSSWQSSQWKQKNNSECVSDIHLHVGRSGSFNEGYSYRERLRSVSQTIPAMANTQLV